MKWHYSIFIQWSDEDRAYLVTLPEFGKDPQTHGETYEEAIKNAQEVLDLLLESFQENGLPLPEPSKYGKQEPGIGKRKG